MASASEVLKFLAAFAASFIGIVIIYALSLVGIVLGVFDIIVGVKWESCHLEGFPDIYLIVLGSLSLATIVFHHVFKKKDEKDDEEESPGQRFANLISLGAMGVLIWGMTIFFDSEQGYCNGQMYDYGYYRTLVTMFFLVALFGVIILGLSCVCAVGCLQAMQK